MPFLYEFWAVSAVTAMIPGWNNPQKRMTVKYAEMSFKNVLVRVLRPELLVGY